MRFREDHEAGREQSFGDQVQSWEERASEGHSCLLGDIADQFGRILLDVEGIRHLQVVFQELP